MFVRDSWRLGKAWTASGGTRYSYVGFLQDGNDLDGFATPSLPEAVATLGQLVASVSALALTLLVLATRRPWRSAARRVGPVVLTPRVFALEAGSGLGFLPRPPPRS